MGRLEPFGVFAIRKGYATSLDIQEGVAKQETLERQGKPRPLLAWRFLVYCGAGLAEGLLR